MKCFCAVVLNCIRAIPRYMKPVEHHFSYPYNRPIFPSIIMIHCNAYLVDDLRFRRNCAKCIRKNISLNILYQKAFRIVTVLVTMYMFMLMK